MAGLIFGVLVLMLAAGWGFHRLQTARGAGAVAGTRLGARDRKSGHTARASAAPRGEAAGRGGRVARRYAAVQVRRGRDACAAVGAFRDQVILAADAPALPVAGCDRAQCGCRYEFLADRRQDDRRTPYGVEHGMVIGDAGLDKRRGRDRRVAND